MRIVHICEGAADEKGGAVIAMRALIERQRREGHEVFVLSRRDRSVGYRLLHGFACVLMKVAFGHCYSGGLLPSGLARKANAFRPDVIYLHCLQHGTSGIRELLVLKAPIKWYVHDLWPINGVCTYCDEGLFEIPMPRRMRWLDRKAREVKREVVARLRGLEVVVASEWMKCRVKASSAFQGVPVRVVPLGLDPVFEKVRQSGAWEVDPGKLLFVTPTTVKSPVKGYDRLLAALEALPDDVRRQVKVKVCADMTQEDLAREYCTAFALAFPSRQETYGLVKHEALACGCPVIVFDETACPEGVEHGKNGWIARNECEFAKGIEHFWRVGRGMSVEALGR